MAASTHASEPSEQDSRLRGERLLVFFFLALFVLMMARLAWLSDDAYITFRTVDNLANGYGLTWNVAERVQVYTHPLWMFVVSVFYFFTREIYFTTLILSIAISATVATLFAFRIAPTPAAAILGLALMTFSKAFVEYSTSGLENPLSHLLLALYVVLFLKGERNLKWLSHVALLCALAAFNRMDTLVFFLPGLVVGFQAIPRDGRVMALAKGFLPLLVWESFCFFYYGFLFPNTAYAKLNTGISSADLAFQGVCYFMNSLNLDPLTLVVIAAGIASAFSQRERRLLALAIGGVLYLLYTLRIGGDFMSGRFLSTVFFMGLCLLASAHPLDLRGAAIGLLGLLLAGFFSPHAQHLLDLEHPLSKQTPVIDNKGVADERAYYFPATGLAGISRGQALPYHAWALEGHDARKQGHSVLVRDNIGLFGFYAGPDVHILDNWALADPLLARLPMRAQDWRIGHFQRAIPAGYIATLESGENRIEDPKIANYYDQLALITRGPLFSPRRLLTALRMNLGWYDSLIESPN
ncbi:MAG: Terminal beta-(1-_2)-arabinofuranosyltransferase [bacterium]|nr:Terminal beta-(1->2)-arabinofuranosyltransferase [bacterium]